MQRPPRIRPRFELSTDLSEREVKERVKAEIAREGNPVEGLFAKGRIELVPDPKARHFWSPQLTIDVVEEEEGATALRGRFGPHPHVWTLYVAMHAVGAFGTIGAAMFGISQHIAGQSPWALWALPASPVLAALVWALAFVGQGLGAEQMYMLRRLLEEALDINPPRTD